MSTTRTPSSNPRVATALPRKAGIGLMACLAAAALLPAAPASAGEALLETVRRAASAQAGQPVQLVPETVNLAGDWALVFGGVSGEDGTTPDWSRARDAVCHEDLDKALWAIARHGPAGWELVELAICASEPPYWNLEDDGATAFARPCALYRGLQVGEHRTAEDQCRAWQQQSGSAPPAP